MPLRISLKPEERLIVGGAVVRNAGRRGLQLMVENDVPILRGKEVMGLADATSPCRRIYFAIQLMYVDPEHLPDHQALFTELMAEVAEASPSMRARLDEITELTAAGKHYQALRLTRKLIEYEEELISHVASRR
jgi:flagellar biosynthesis repressor protein FlbT